MTYILKLTWHTSLLARPRPPSYRQLSVHRTRLGNTMQVRPRANQQRPKMDQRASHGLTRISLNTLCVWPKKPTSEYNKKPENWAFDSVAQEWGQLLPARTRIIARKKISGGRNHWATKIAGALRLSAGWNTVRKRQSILTRESTQDWGKTWDATTEIETSDETAEDNTRRKKNQAPNKLLNQTTTTQAQGTSTISRQISSSPKQLSRCGTARKLQEN
jgi:hypothetical protein